MEDRHHQKIAKYLHVTSEIKKLWNLKEVRVLPIICGINGEISKSLHVVIKTLEFPKNTYSTIQKAAILGSCHIVQKVLNITP